MLTMHVKDAYYFYTKKTSQKVHPFLLCKVQSWCKRALAIASITNKMKHKA